MTLMVTKHEEGARGIRGNGQKAVHKLKPKQLKIYIEMIRATQETPATGETNRAQTLHGHRSPRSAGGVQERQADDLERPRPRSSEGSVRTTPHLPGRIKVEQDK